MTTILRDDGLRVDHISLQETPENVDLAGPGSPNAWQFVQSVLDRVAEIQDDLVIDLLVRLRDQGDTGRRMPLEEFLEQQGVDVAELEAELDSEDE